MSSTFQKLKNSLVRTKDSIAGKISRVVIKRRIDDALLNEIEQILIEADVGVKAATRLIESVREKAKERGVTEGEEVVSLLKEEIIRILSQSSTVAGIDSERTPVVWLVVGVNGVGKTTTIGKLATLFSLEGHKAAIAACDTFRAAAIEQVAIWAERSNVDIVKSQSGSDPAAVAFDAAKAAAARSVDILIIDTAGRLHTKANLMEELKKIKRVIEKALPDAPVHSKLIIDGSTGQNALSQVRVFTEAVGCDGIIVTKLDGTAKGGVIIAVTEELGVPVEFIGLGEGIDDLQRFEPKQFTEALFA
ncbi:MAG: signal recognition particle-docking protein FtsY [candidate division Zixibacteria bacterium]|nr:signal recognition particle-docking protein FtsY [candidate division Zixibacteria bacterium]MCK4605688.1 signal recognition particle-docking protein FtsY [candidate division Zixibacteria bacterium]